jgi:hypothetical protein
LNDLTSLVLTGPEVKRNFDKNYLSILQKLNPDLPARYLIDFIHKAQLSGADPRKNQIHLTTYFSSKLGHKVGVTVFSYHFFLNQANLTGEFGGVTVESRVEEVFNPMKGENEKQLVSIATAHRKGREAISFKARWNEFVNKNNPMWREKPYIMLEKTAIANALRWAFPEALSGMFIQEEIREDQEDELTQTIAAEFSHVKAEEEVKKDEKILEQAKNSCENSEKVEQIKELAKKITKGMSLENKIDWQKTNLAVDKFDELKKRSPETLTMIIEQLEKILKNPIKI